MLRKAVLEAQEGAPRGAARVASGGWTLGSGSPLAGVLSATMPADSLLEDALDAPPWRLGLLQARSRSGACGRCCSHHAANARCVVDPLALVKV